MDVFLQGLDDTGLQQWLPQGAAVTAVVAVVVLFLRHIRESSNQLSELAKQCHAHQEKAQSSFERSLDRIVAANEKNTDRIIKRLDAQLNEAK